MRRLTTLFLTALLLLSLIACGAKDAWQEQYDLGMRYLNEGNYEEAVIAFTAAIEIDAKRPEAYLGAADGYVGLGDYASARSILERGYAETGDESLKNRLDALPFVWPDDTVVEWSDPVFERLVREAIGISSDDVTVKDLDQVERLVIMGDTYIAINPDDAEDGRCGWRYVSGADGSGSLFAFYAVDDVEYTTRGAITNVDALQYFRNLYSVMIVANHITDVSVLNDMPNVTDCYFWGNDISDLTPLERFDFTNHGGFAIQEEQFLEIGSVLPIG